MQRKGVRSRHSIGSVFAAARPGLLKFAPSQMRQSVWVCAFLCIGLMLSAGCSLMDHRNESIVRVTTKRDTKKAIHHTNAGIRSLNHHHIDKAAKHFRDAVAADFEYGPAHSNLGLMHFEQGNLYQAVMAFEQAREYLPDDPVVVYNLALALESAGRTDEALDLYYTANAMDQANPNFLGNLTRLRVRLGERDEILQQQLRDLVLIETRPDWRRWADTQLALSMNDALDRGPETPDLQTTVDDATNPDRSDLRNKIIDLTPGVPATLESPIPDTEEFDAIPDGPELEGRELDHNALEDSQLEDTLILSPPSPLIVTEPESMLEEGVVEDLSEPDDVTGADFN